MKWKISEVFPVDAKNHELFVYKSGTKEECRMLDTLRTLVDEDRFQFSMVYNGNKMLGYHFRYNQPKLKRFHQSERSVIWFYNGKMKEPKLNVLYEDQVIRLLSYVEDDPANPEYWLVGRWRY